MFSFISAIFSIIPIIFGIVFIVNLKKRKSILFELKNGQKCFACKSDILVDDYDLLNNILNAKENFQMCKSCSRNETLDKIVNRGEKSKLNKFKMMLISDKYWKVMKKCVYIMIFLLVLDLSLRFLWNIKWFNIIFNILLIFYWFVIWYRNKLTTDK